MRHKPSPTQRQRYWLFGFAAIALMGSCLQAQEQTPVRQLGQSTAANPYELALDGQVKRQNREASPDSISSSANGAEDSWWDGLESVAEKSMDQSDWGFKFGVTAGWEYDSNFKMGARGTEQETSLFSFSPYGTVTYGQPGHGLDFQLRYAPEYRWFTEESVDSILNHAVNATLGLNGAHSRVSLTTSYAKNEGGNVEVGGLVTSDIYGAKLMASYDISPKTSIGGSLGYDVMEYETLNGYEKLTGSFFADYAVTPKVRLGLGLGYDHLEQENSLSHDVFTGGLRFTWAMSAKFGFSGNLSAEYREFEGGESILSPTWSVGAYYKPSPKLSTNLSFYRRASPSIGLSNTLFYSSGAALSITYSLTERIRFGTTAGYEISSYEAADAGRTIDREDRYFFIRPTISYTFNSHLSANLFYQYSTNDSTSGPASCFDRNQVGLYLSLAF